MTATVKFAPSEDINNHLVGKVKENRVAIDGIIKNINRIKAVENDGKGGRELSLVITKLEESRMWLKVVEDILLDIK